MHPCVLQDLPVTFQAFQPQVLTKATPVTPIAPETFHVFPVFPDIPVFPDTPETFRTFQSFMTFQPFQATLQVPVFPGIPPHSSILQLECIFYNFYRSYSSIGFHRNSTECQLNNYKHFYKHYILQRKGDVVISVIVEDVEDKTLPRCQDDILSRKELIPSFVLSSDNTNYKNDIQ